MTSPRRLASKVDDFKDDLEDNIERGLGGGMRSTTDKTKENIKDNDSNVHGNLLDSVEFNRGVVDGYLFSAQTEIGAKHAPFVEYGTGSHQDPLPSWAKTSFKAPDPRPPIGKIRQWIIRKGISPHPTNRTADLIADQEQLAWMLASSIGTYGNRPHPYARPAAREGFDETVDKVTAGMLEAIRRF